MEILRYREVNKGAMKAFFSLKVPKMGLIINECVLFESKGRRWISFPQKMVEANGEKKYYPYVQFSDKSLMATFSEKVMPAIDEYVKSSHGESNEAVRAGQMEMPF